MHKFNTEYKSSFSDWFDYEKVTLKPHGDWYNPNNILATKKKPEKDFVILGSKN